MRTISNFEIEALAAPHIQLFIVREHIISSMRASSECWPGVRVAGTDSRASNPDLNLWVRARIFGGIDDLQPSVLEMATWSGARRWDAQQRAHWTGPSQIGDR